MRMRFGWGKITTAVVAVLALAVKPASGQGQIAYKAPRTADGKPNLNGIWQAMGTAHWDIEGHAARAGPVVALGAAGAVPAGLGVVEGGEIPYQPWAAAKKKENVKNWLTADPEVKCYLPGVPRATYMPFPFQIVQTPKHILMAYEFAGATRTIFMDSKAESPVDTWMGWSHGRWEGETLVVDTTNFAAKSFYMGSAEKLHIIERFTRVSPDMIRYEVTVEDPTTWTKPWTAMLPLRRSDQIIYEFACHEGNDSVSGILSGERAVEKKAAEAAAGKAK